MSGSTLASDEVEEKKKKRAGRSAKSVSPSRWKSESQNETTEKKTETLDGV